MALATEKIHNYINRLIQLSEGKDNYEYNPKDYRDPKLPAYLTHCTNTQHFFSILKDKQLGGKEVTSGNMTQQFDISSFSPIPLDYDYCIVFNAHKLQEINKNKFRPSCYPITNTKDCKFFDEKGWGKSSTIKDETRRPIVEEKEWHMKNPIKFQMDDIEAVITRYNKYPYRASKALQHNEEEIQKLKSKMIHGQKKYHSQSYKIFQKIH